MRAAMTSATTSATTRAIGSFEFRSATQPLTLRRITKGAIVKLIGLMVLVAVLVAVVLVPIMQRLTRRLPPVGARHYIGQRALEHRQHYWR